MEQKKFKEIKHLLPADSWAAWRNKENNGEFEEELVMHHKGDWETSNINLDDPGGNGESIFLILIEGNLKAGNIYNKDTDGATGLIILGNLTADNIVVGGQEIYVTGNLYVKDLYWGHYNHGTLISKGAVQARVFISTDYSFDYKRFKQKDRIDLEYLLWDEDKGYKERDPLPALFEEHFLSEPDDEYDDEIYSWSSWLDRREILGALDNNESVLRADFLKDPQAPSFFQDDLISETNIFRFADSDVLTGYTGEADRVMLQYKDNDVYRRVLMLNGQLHTLTVYFQQEENFGCVIYFAQDSPGVYRIAKAYKQLDGERWLELDSNAPASYHQFLEENWRTLLQQYSEMVYYREKFRAEVTGEKLEELLSLPLIRAKHYDYYNEDHVVEYGAFQWGFRPPGNAGEKTPRISIIRVLGDDEYDFYHFDIAEGQAPRLNTQANDGYEATVKEVPVFERDKYRKALKYFEQMEKTIRRKNEEFVSES
ncbi:hypothetical protein [Chitinophaga tropicalis]|uniref:Uncharacterized protein n=1 Tax=Chitinophaga tropicalis TaxID=2683588 RepID=A0A7K1U792_9BACT|nr:hypothetical protein [Chitinophaga tropicalis]MVT09865.1 hypothetical protein [Chitinophaga tropicalis]